MAGRCFTKAQKLLILRRAGYRCQFCGTPLTEKNFEADHRIPYSKGGTTEVWNALALCESCNRRKSDRGLIQDSQASISHIQLAIPQSPKYRLISLQS